MTQCIYAMRHEISLDGPAFRIRPVCDSDAEFILRLRTNPILNRFLHSTSNIIDDQLGWLAAYYVRPDDYYFVIERRSSGRPEGVIAIYGIEKQEKCGEWGRWILLPHSLAAIESAMLIYRCAFEVLGLHFVYCRTVAANRSVVSFHDSCGICDRVLLPRYFDIGGERHDAIQHSIGLSQWPDMGMRLLKLATLTSRRLIRA